MFENTNHIVLKITKQCNLRCKYCYIEDKDSESNKIMSFDIFKKVIDKILEDKVKILFAKQHTKKDSILFKKLERLPSSVDITFHGGEPTTVPLYDLQKFCSYVKHKSVETGIDVQLSMQTNGTLLNEDLLELCKFYNINLGVSYDGISENSSKGRIESDTSFYETLFSQANQYNVSAGALCVVSKFNIDHALDTIKQVKDMTYSRFPKLNIVEDVLNIGNLEVTSQEFFEKVTLPILKEFISDKPFEHKLLERNTLNAINQYCKSIIYNSYWSETNPTYTFSDNTTGNCNTKFCGAGSKVIEIDPDGTFNKCGRYSVSDEVSYIGSIQTPDLLSVKTILILTQFLIKKHYLTLEAHCDFCIAKNICGSGCMAFAYSKYRHYSLRKELVCDNNKQLIKFLINHEKDIIHNWVTYKCYLQKSDSFMLKNISSTSIFIKLAKKYNLNINFSSNNKQLTLFAKKND